MTTEAIRAQAHIHHAYFLGLQLMVSSNKGPEVMGDWMFRLFRRQHTEKFLSIIKLSTIIILFSFLTN